MEINLENPLQAILIGIRKNRIMRTIIILIPLFIFGCSSLENDEEKSDLNTEFEKNISSLEIAKIRDSIIGKWKLNRIIFMEAGADRPNGRSRLNTIARLFVGNQLDSTFIEFKENKELLINDKRGKWEIDSNGRVSLQGDIYVNNVPILKDFPLKYSEDFYFSHLTSDFKNTENGLSFQVIYWLERLTDDGKIIRSSN